MDEFLVAYATRSESVFQVEEPGKLIHTKGAVHWFRGCHASEDSNPYRISTRTWGFCLPRLSGLVHKLATRELFAVEMINMQNGGLSLRGLVRKPAEGDTLDGKAAWVKILNDGRVLIGELKSFHAGRERVLRAIREASEDE